MRNVKKILIAPSAQFSGSRGIRIVKLADASKNSRNAEQLKLRNEDGRKKAGLRSIPSRTNIASVSCTPARSNAIYWR